MEKGIKKTYGRPLLKYIVDRLNNAIAGDKVWDFITDANGKYHIINHTRKIGVDPLSAKEACMYFLGLTEGLVNHVKADTHVDVTPDDPPLDKRLPMTSKSLKARLEDDASFLSLLVLAVVEMKALKIMGDHRFLFDRCYKMLKAGHTLVGKDKIRIINLLTSYYYRDIERYVTTGMKRLQQLL